MTPATLVDGVGIARGITNDVGEAVRALCAAGHAAPNLHVILVGDDPASVTYVRNKRRVATALGIDFNLHHLSAGETTDSVLELVARLNASPGVDAILVQLPLPVLIDPARVIEAVDPGKDADGFHPLNIGRLAEGRPGLALPGTPAGCMELLRHYAVPVSGARAVVIGRSTIVGRPMALLLVNANATVTICHSRTVDLPGICREADILVVAAGRPGMVDSTYVKPGACVIDVGTTLVEGKLCGDVDFDSVRQVAGHLSPVPGGVGPMTIAMLMRNTLALARARRVITD